MEIHHIYTGRGESNFMIFPDGTSLLVDVGDWDPSNDPNMCELLPDASRRAGTWVARYVNRVNPHGNEVDYLMVSHFHNDHTGDSTLPLPQTEGQDPNYVLVGITEAGTVYSGNIKSSVGLGIILYQGIGDTIRVSLTGNPLEEVRTAKLILKTLGLRRGGVEVVSCPTCGRTKIDLIGLANQVEAMVQQYPLDIRVAVMGCVVNGPGEAKEADLGIAGGIGEGLLIRKGEIIRKVPESQLLSALREELDQWNG